MEKNNRVIRRMLAGGVILMLLCLLISNNLKGYQDTVGTEKMKENVTYFRDFSLKTIDGGTFGSEDMKDYKLVVINGWGPWCSACVSEMPELEKLSGELKEQGILVVGIVADYQGKLDLGQSDYAEQVRETVKSTGVTYPIPLSDAKFEQEVQPMMGGAFPGTWFVKGDGTLVGFVSGSKTAEGWKKTIGEIMEREGLK